MIKTIKLKYPIEVHGVSLTTVTVDRFPTVRDLIIAGGDLDDDELPFKVAANIVQLAPADFERLDFEDIETIQEAVQEMSDASPSDISGIQLRRLTGRDILDLKKDHGVTGLVKSLATLTGLPKNDFDAMNSSQFMTLVSKLMGFIGRRARK